MTFHRQPHDRKQDVADDIRDWVRVLLGDPKAELTTLERLSLPDLTLLWIAIDQAGEAWMSELVHDVMSDKGDA
jgi:hypothetical protein